MKVDLAAVVLGFSKALVTADHLLTRAVDHTAEHDISEAEFLDWRLAPDMYSFRTQLQVVCTLVGQWGARAAGTDVPTPPQGEMNVEQLRAAIAETRRSFESLRPEQFAGRDETEITIDLVQIKPTMTLGQWVVGFATTNILFHLSIAYAILRSRGLQLSKPDLFAGGF